MSHELSERNGKIQFAYAKHPVWHGLGTKVESDMTAEEAIQHAGLDYEYIKEPIFTKSGELVPSTNAIIREFDRRIIGSVGDKYHIIQPKKCFDFMDSLIGENQAVYHTAGAILNGKIVFMLVKLPDSLSVGDDKMEKYLFLSNTYDGSSALQVMFTPVRVVCWNTYQIALNKETPARISIRHTGNYEEKLRQARSVLGLTNAYYQVMGEKFNRLLDTKFSEGEFEKYAEQIFPATPQEDGSVKTSKQSKDNRTLLAHLFTDGPGQKPVAGTKWAALNAVTDYIDHHAKVRIGEKTPAEARANSAIFGGGSYLRQKAFDLLSV